jgi:hypothetical protein
MDIGRAQVARDSDETGQAGRAILPVTNSVYCSSYSALRSQAAAVSTSVATSSAARMARLRASFTGR